jgi:hypothetical protein
MAKFRATPGAVGAVRGAIAVTGQRRRKMAYRFEALLAGLAGLGKYPLDGVSVVDKDAEYLGARLLVGDEASFCDGLVYVGDCSKLPSLPLKSRCAFLLGGNGIERVKLGEVGANAAAFAPAADMLRLWHDLLDKFYVSAKAAASATALLKSLANGKGMQFLLDACADILQNPVLVSLVTETSFLASRRYEITDPSAIESFDSYFVSEKYRKPYDDQKIKEKLDSSQAPIIFNAGFKGGVRRIIGHIKAGDQHLGSVLILESNKPFEDADVHLTQVVCDVMSVEFQRGNSFKSSQLALNDSHLRGLICGKPRSDTFLLDWLRSLGWEGRSNYYALSIDAEPISSNCYNVDPARTYIEDKIPNCKTAFHGGNVLVLANPSSDAQLDEIKKIGAYVKKVNASCGISMRFANINHFYANLQNAGEAIVAGKLLNRKSAIYFFADLRVYIILLKASDSINLNEFYHKALDKLTEHDEKYGTEYYKTFYRLLHSGGDKAATANNLFIHRNTLNYRLSKIFDLIDVDLENGGESMFLQLSYKIKELIRCIEAPASASAGRSAADGF